MKEYEQYVHEGLVALSDLSLSCRLSVGGSIWSARIGEGCNNRWGVYACIYSERDPKLSGVTCNGGWEDKFQCNPYHTDRVVYGLGK